MRCTSSIQSAPPQTNAASHEDLISLSQAARLSPGRPSANCIWRWCRRGVLSRTGERVHLQHVRLGGKLLTRRAWVEDFGARLAAADAGYFAHASGPGAPAPRRPSRRRPAAGGHDDDSLVQAELEAEGLA